MNRETLAILVNAAAGEGQGRDVAIAALVAEFGRRVAIPDEPASEVRKTSTARVAAWRAGRVSGRPATADETGDATGMKRDETGRFAVATVSLSGSPSPSQSQNSESISASERGFSSPSPSGNARGATAATATATPPATATVATERDVTPAYRRDTTPPSDIPITDEIRASCAMAGARPPTKADVVACLSNAKKKGFVRADWGAELVSWQCKGKGFDAARESRSPVNLSPEGIDQTSFEASARRKQRRDAEDAAMVAEIVGNAR